MGSKSSKIIRYPNTDKGETCKEYVGRVAINGYYLVNPWVDNMAGWTEQFGYINRPFPRDGSNDDFHMNMVKGLCLGDTETWPFFGPDPNWDMSYMRAGGEQWLTIAPHWQPEQKMKSKISKSKKDKTKEDPPSYNKLYPSLKDIDLISVVAAARLPPPMNPQILHDDVVPPVVSIQQPDITVSAPPETVSPLPLTSTPEKMLSPSTTRTGQHYGGSINFNSPSQNNVTHTPFMTVGDHLIKRPIEIEDLNRIIKHCPKPTITPTGTIAYLKKACTGRSYTQEDMRLIIDGIIDHHTNWNWANVPILSQIEGNATATNYSLNTEAGVTLMWTQLTTEMTRVFKVTSSLPIAVACKQKSTESVIEFWKKFKSCWSEEAGMPSSADAGPLMISTFISNLHPTYALTVKQTISTWTSDTIARFEQHLYEKEAAGCFDIKKPDKIPSHNYQNKSQNNRGRGRGRGRQGQIQGRCPPNQGQQYPPQYDNQTRQDCCFNCGQSGHWARDCPYPSQKPQTAQGSDQRQVQGKPRFHVDWQNQNH